MVARTAGTPVSGGCQKFKLISSYLSERSLVVVTNGEGSERYQIHSGVPQGGIWSQLLFDLFVKELPQQLQHAAMLCYADDTTLLMRIPTGHREMCAALLNSDLESPLNYGKSWLLEFEVNKTQALTVSRKRNPNKNPPLVMDGDPIAKSKTLKIHGYTHRLFEGVAVPSLKQRREAAAIIYRTYMSAYVRKCETTTQTSHS